MHDKAALRKLLRSLHGGQAQREAESRLICAHILACPWYRKARVIGGYVPLKWEADVTPVLQHALQSGKILALPLCGKAPQMTLRRVDSMEELRPGAYGIPEPGENAQVIPVDALDLLLVPLEGIDPRGARLGKGGGYYDHLLDGQSVSTMGCALSWQRVAHIPREAWDISLRACADRNGVHEFMSEK